MYFVGLYKREIIFGSRVKGYARLENNNNKRDGAVFLAREHTTFILLSLEVGPNKYYNDHHISSGGDVGDGMGIFFFFFFLLAIFEFDTCRCLHCNDLWCEQK